MRLDLYSRIGIRRGEVREIIALIVRSNIRYEVRVLDTNQIYKTRLKDIIKTAGISRRLLVYVIDKRQGKELT